MVKHPKVFVKTFSGANTTCMNDYVKASVRSSPDHFTLVQMTCRRIINQERKAWR